MGRLMLNDRCYTGSDNLLMLNDESYSGGRIANLIEKNITANGTYNASDDGADGYSEVNVDVASAIVPKTITQNGTYNASEDSADGYNPVVVNVEGGGSPLTQFRYLKWHITDNGNNNNVLQIAEVEFRDENDVAFTMPTGFTATSSLSPYVPEDDVYVLFDGTDRKLVILPFSGTTVEDITIDLGVGNYLDISEYPYFCWKSGNDDSQYFGRPPRVWQLYGANESDFSDAVILDDTTIPINTQNGIWCYKSRMVLNVIDGSSYEQITDVTGFTNVYNTSVPYGSNGDRVNTALGITDELTIINNMRKGWSDSTSAYYDSENQIDAYGGYDFDEEINIAFVRFYLGRFELQNTTLTATVQWLDSNDNWNDLTDIEITTTLPYPVNYFDVEVNKKCYGVRWVHKKTPNKTSGNNICFFGMSLYKEVGSSGGGGLQLHNILTAGVISNNSDYATATFEDSIGDDDNYLLMRMLKDGSYRYMTLAKSDIPESGEYAFTFSDVQCAISQTAIRSTYYSGSWRYIYVDIVGSNDLIFPQSE